MFLHCECGQANILDDITNTAAQANDVESPLALLSQNFPESRKQTINQLKRRICLTAAPQKHQGSPLWYCRLNQKVHLCPRRGIDIAEFDHRSPPPVAFPQAYRSSLSKVMTGALKCLPASREYPQASTAFYFYVDFQKTSFNTHRRLHAWEGTTRPIHLR